METTTVNNLRKGDTLPDGRIIESSVRLSLLSRGKSMSKKYAQSHCEVRFQNAPEGIWHAGTAVNVKR